MLTSYFKSASARLESRTECEAGFSCNEQQGPDTTTPFQPEPALEKQPELACDILCENLKFETSDVGMPSSSEIENSNDEDNFLEAPLKNKKFDGRSNKLAFTIKWKRAFSRLIIVLWKKDGFVRHAKNTPIMVASIGRPCRKSMMLTQVFSFENMKIPESIRML